VRSGRDFPWRTGTDYEVALAEILLQKTRGEAVEPVWRTLRDRYPTPQHLKRARVAAIRRIVAPLGLGEQRSQRLKALADSWDTECLSSLGPYGCAVVELSRGRVHSSAPVDGNIARVIQRYAGLSWEVGEPRKKAELKNLAFTLLRGRPAIALRTLYALVDLGALVCTPRNPKCPLCPLRGTCASATDFLRS